MTGRRLPRQMCPSRSGMPPVPRYTASRPAATALPPSSCPSASIRLPRTSELPRTACAPPITAPTPTSWSARPARMSSVSTFSAWRAPRSSSRSSTSAAASIPRPRKAIPRTPTSSFTTTPMRKPTPPTSCSPLRRRTTAMAATNTIRTESCSMRTKTGSRPTARSGGSSRPSRFRLTRRSSWPSSAASTTRRPSLRP